MRYFAKLKLCYEFELNEKFIKEKDFTPKMENVKEKRKVSRKRWDKLCLRLKEGQKSAVGKEEG